LLSFQRIILLSLNTLVVAIRERMLSLSIFIVILERMFKNTLVVIECSCCYHWRESILVVIRENYLVVVVVIRECLRVFLLLSLERVFLLSLSVLVVSLEREYSCCCCH
jgi:hypothetical protein